jgi:predicted ATPase
MIVTKLKLTNWRNFLSVDVDLGMRCFIVGPNACGKSNLLDVFRFLRDIAKPQGGGLQQAVQSRGGFSKLKCLTARRTPNIEIEVHLANNRGEPPIWRYELGIRQEGSWPKRLLVAHERVWNGEKLVLNRPDDPDKKDTARLTETFLEQTNANFDFREVTKYFESVSYLHLVPQLLRAVDSNQTNKSGEDFYGRNFLVKVAKTPEATRRKRLQKIEQVLRAAVPQFTDLTDMVDEAGTPHLEVTYKHWRPDAGRQREDQFSDGTIRLIGLFWSLLESNTLLLLEEPELSLHNRIVSTLAPAIYKLQSEKQRQVILSTHSSALLSDIGIGSEEVLLLVPGKEGTKVQVASKIQEINLLLEGGMTIGEAVLPRTDPENFDQFLLEFSNGNKHQHRG